MRFASISFALSAIFVTLILFSLGIVVVFSLSSNTCAVVAGASCAGGDTKLFSIDASGNVAQNNAFSQFCCNANTATYWQVGGVCSQTALFSVYNLTNSRVAQNITNSSALYNLCLNSTAGFGFCEYKTSACNATQICMGSLSTASLSNSSWGSCGALGTNVCCTFNQTITLPGINVAGTTFWCGAQDGICPADYVNSSASAPVCSPRQDPDCPQTTMCGNVTPTTSSPKCLLLGSAYRSTTYTPANWTPVPYVANIVLNACQWTANTTAGCEIIGGVASNTSCAAPEGGFLLNGQSRVYFNTTAYGCGGVACPNITRTCTNTVLSGHSDFRFTSCNLVASTCTCLNPSGGGTTAPWGTFPSYNYANVTCNPALCTLSSSITCNGDTGAWIGTYNGSCSTYYTYTWDNVAWGTCSKTCARDQGNGTQTRTETCGGGAQTCCNPALKPPESQGCFDNTTCAPVINSFSVTPSSQTQGTAQTWSASASTAIGASGIAQTRAYIVGSSGLGEGAWVSNGGASTSTLSSSRGTNLNADSFYLGTGTYTARYYVNDSGGRSVYSDVSVTIACGGTDTSVGGVCYPICQKDGVSGRPWGGGTANHADTFGPAGYTVSSNACSCAGVTSGAVTCNGPGWSAPVYQTCTPTYDGSWTVINYGACSNTCTAVNGVGTQTGVSSCVGTCCNPATEPTGGALVRNCYDNTTCSPVIDSFTITPQNQYQGTDQAWAGSSHSYTGASGIAQTRAYIVSSSGGAWTANGGASTSSFSRSQATSMNANSFFNGVGTYTARYEVQDAGGRTTSTDLSVTISCSGTDTAVGGVCYPICQKDGVSGRPWGGGTANHADTFGPAGYTVSSNACSCAGVTSGAVTCNGPGWSAPVYQSCTVTYDEYWYASSGWSACSNSCARDYGAGTQTRTVSCSGTGTCCNPANQTDIVASQSCTVNTGCTCPKDGVSGRPWGGGYENQGVTFAGGPYFTSTSQTCCTSKTDTTCVVGGSGSWSAQVYSTCTPTFDGTWTYNAWSACSNTCGNGTKTRTYYCSGPCCNPATEPQAGDLTAACTDTSGCTGTWSVGNYGACSNTCALQYGAGTKTGSAICTGGPCDPATEPTGAALTTSCSDNTGCTCNNPWGGGTTLTGNTWGPSGYTASSNACSCDSVVATQAITCSGITWSSTLYQTCTPTGPYTGTWSTGNWGVCVGNVGEEGVRARNVTCSDSCCDPLTEPASTEGCTVSNMCGGVPCSGTCGCDDVCDSGKTMDCSDPPVCDGPNPCEPPPACTACQTSADCSSPYDVCEHYIHNGVEWGCACVVGVSDGCGTGEWQVDTQGNSVINCADAGLECCMVGGAHCETPGSCTGCGDGSCGGGETCTTCPDDCGTCAPTCGDTVCNGAETCSTCTTDCGPCTCTGTWTLDSDWSCDTPNTCAGTIYSSKSYSCVGNCCDGAQPGDEIGGICYVQPLPPTCGECTGSWAPGDWSCDTPNVCAGVVYSSRSYSCNGNCCTTAPPSDDIGGICYVEPAPPTCSGH